MKKILLIFIFNIIVLNIFCEQCVVSGIAKGYAGKELVLKTYTDEIVFSEKNLSSVVVDSVGNFRFEFEINNTVSCFIDLGAYQTILFVEPANKYEVELPPFKALTQADQFNPYFKPEKIFLNIKNVDEKDINTKIARFENTFDLYYVKCALSPSVDTIKTSISKIQALSPDTTNLFFHQYKNYKYAMMANLNEKYSPNWAIDNYLSKTPPSYQNLAFWESFNVVFANIFDAFEGKMEQRYFDKALTDADFEAMSAIIQYRFGIEDKSYRELIIIKGLYDAYFSQKHSPSSMLSLMNKWKSQMMLAENITILNNIIEKLNEKRDLTDVFNFNLPDEKGKFHQLSDYRGKYVYLNFCNTKISLSKKDFGILNRYNDSYKKDLVIINIFTDEDKQTMISFLKSFRQQNVNLFWDNNTELIKKFQVINIPTYFLIDRKGRLLLAPAPTPDESFEQSFDEILAKEKSKMAPEKPKGLGE